MKGTNMCIHHIDFQNDVIENNISTAPNVVSDNIVEQSSEQIHLPLFNRYIELIKNEIDVNPCTGESKDKTIVDIYIRDDRVDVMGWGWNNTYRPGNKTIDEIVDTIKDVFLSDGFRVVTEEIIKQSPSHEANSAHNIIRQSLMFFQAIPEIHPETRQMRDFTELVMYRYDDRVELHSWGSFTITHPSEYQNVSDISIECISALLNDGYSIVPSASIFTFPVNKKDIKQAQDCSNETEFSEPDGDMEI